MHTLPARYTLPRAAFDNLTAAVADQIPASPRDPWWTAETVADWRHFRRDRCFAIQCPHEWVGYAVFITAREILAAELQAPPTVPEFEAMMLELTARQHVWIDGNRGVVVYWPTITVAPE
ncbi:hypothetical protein [Nocardia asiatica]|uniref:hypothetical protein n=1 Tax=Nocardia asiatica TaxID=209252 RepID=UPI0002EBB155|nr:hypothetical protein [Nocardia asiatica]